MENQQPLDPRLNATEITELGNLTTSEVTIKIPKITRADAESMVVSSEHVIIEEMDYANVPMTGAFCVGDCILKVNDDPPQSSEHFKKIMVDLSPCTVVVSRRSFVTAPGELRLRKSLIAMGLPYQKGFSYQVITCKKQTWDRFLTTSFGFLAEDVTVPQVNTNKFIIGEINTNTAAEKYFSVGDGLIDFRGAAIKPKNDPNALKQFNLTFQQGVDMEVLVERPVSKDARNLTEQFIKKHLLRHDTPAMSDDAINIGINAALYHHMLWRKMASVSILVRPPPAPVVAAIPKKKKQKKKKAGKTKRKTRRTKEDATAIEGTEEVGDDAGKRITLEHKKNYQEISTDVQDGTELETVGYRYSSEGEDDEEKDEKEDEDDTEKKKSPVKAAPKRVVVPFVPSTPAAKKTDSRKSKRGLFSSLPFIRLKK